MTPKTYHRQNFDRLQAMAQQVINTLTANQALSGDQAENIDNSMTEMDKAVRNYLNTKGTKDVVAAFSRAATAWAELKAGRGTRQNVIGDLEVISQAEYQPPNPHA